MNRPGTPCTVVGLLLLLAGCAGFRAGKLGDIRDWPLASGGGKVITLGIRTEVYSNGSLVAESGALGTGIVDRHVELMYSQSGLFSRIQRNRQPGDILADVRYTHAEEGSVGMAVLSGLTLTLIPVVSHLDQKMVTTFKDADGNVLGTIEKAERVNVWIEALLLVVTPINFPSRIIIRTINDLTRATLVDAKARGWV